MDITSELQPKIIEPQTYSSLPAAAGPNPSDIYPRTFTLYERQVYLPSENVSVYELLRKWMQNLPEEPRPAPDTTGLQLPPQPTPKEPPSPEVSPVEYDDIFSRHDYQPEEVLRKMKEHWVGVRNHWQKRGQKLRERQQWRLAPWLAQSSLQPPPPLAGGMPFNAPMAGHNALPQNALPQNGIWGQ
mmetsp:Transcript_21681/g.36921  ORF Transcript_21681/g.36921 Transcript_21681/m.36921 type:complete len:186 (-) Transcript_21681:225-782(-)